MGTSNCFEIVFFRRFANTTACSSKHGIVRVFSLIGARRDFDNRKLEICFLEYSENSFNMLQRRQFLRRRHKIY